MIENGDPVGHRQRLFLVVRHEDDRGADLPMQHLDLDLHALAQLAVEGAQRLVHQQHGRMKDQGAGKRHALLLAAGKLGGID